MIKSVMEWFGVVLTALVIYCVVRFVGEEVYNYNTYAIRPLAWLCSVPYIALYMFLRSEK